jgi:hypothetical protein
LTGQNRLLLGYGDAVLLWKNSTISCWQKGDGPSDRSAPKQGAEWANRQDFQELPKRVIGSLMFEFGAPDRS